MSARFTINIMAMWNRQTIDFKTKQNHSKTRKECRIMRKTVLLLLALITGVRQAAPIQAATEVKVAGDARVYGVFFANRNFTGWDETGTQTEDRTTIWQRLRLRTDFVANESLKFRFGMRVDDETWGSGYLTAANPQVAIQPYLAYLQFKCPGTDIEMTAGYQPFPCPTPQCFTTASYWPPTTAISPVPPCSSKCRS